MLGAACGAGAPDPRCAEGPAALCAAQAIETARERGLDIAWAGEIAPRAGPDPRAAVAGLAETLAARVAALLVRGALPVVLGGDHSCAIGTWSGVARVLAPRGPLGLVWIDAHMDAHTPATSPSGMLHGMPLACLLGYGDEGLARAPGRGRLDPARVRLVGVRSYEPGEAALLHRLGVRVHFMSEVARRGFDAVLAEALGAVARGAAGVGLSLDLDALDPRDCPAVSSLVARGIRREALARALARTLPRVPLVAVEIVEYNPYRDRDGLGAQLVAELLGLLPVRRAAEREARLAVRRRAA